MKTVKVSEKISVTYGKKKEVAGYFMPDMPEKLKRKLGTLEGKATFTFRQGFKMTTEELLGL